jgi:hypothetical protein
VSVSAVKKTVVDAYQRGHEHEQHIHRARQLWRDFFRRRAIADVADGSASALRSSFRPALEQSDIARRSFGHIICKWDIGWLDWTSRRKLTSGTGLGRMFAVMAQQRRRDCYVSSFLRPR